MENVMNRMLPIDGVIKITGLSRRTVYSEIAEGRFPRPVQLTARRVAWPEDEIKAWLDERVAARDIG